MHISKININNYRLLKNTSINFEEDLSLIIGKNNCGKTSLLSVLSKCIGEKNDIGKFEYYDFNISFQNKLFEIIQQNTIFRENDLAGIQVDIFIEYNDTDNLSRISDLLLDLDPKNTTIVLRFNYMLTNKLDGLKDDFIKYKTEKSHLSEVNAFKKFMIKNHRKYFEFNKYSVLYDYKSELVDEKTFKLLDNKDIDISKIISFKYIDAKREVSNVANAELSILASVYYEKTKAKNEDDTTINQFENQVDSTDEEFDKIYTKVFVELMGKLSQFGGLKKDDTTLKVISQIQVSKLLKDNTTVVYNDDKLNFLPEQYNGLGYLNLFSMIMRIETLFSEFRKDNKTDETPADINILFIEEPEAHTHPQMQYVFIKNIKSLLKAGKKVKDSIENINLQTLITTHSSHIVAECNFDDIKYLVKEKYDDGASIVAKNLSVLETLYQKEIGNENNHFKFLKQYLTLNKSEIFFADKIILIEGDTERILLPAMMKKLDQENQWNTPLLSQNISIIEAGAYSQIYSEFIRFIGAKTVVITDIDTINDKNQECRVIDGINTSNSAIKFYLSEKISNSSANSSVSAKDVLTSLTLEEKTLKSSIIKKQIHQVSKNGYPMHMDNF